MTKFKILYTHNSKQKIGILGGSFDPAHEGHVYISQVALRKLNLDSVIWLVTPQNPMKKTTRYSLDHRVGYAKSLVNGKRIIVSDIERYFNNCYTMISIRKIIQMHPNAQFTWIMGADNVLHINTWEHWKRIFECLDVAIFDRNQFDLKLKHFKAAKIMLKHNYTHIDFIKVRKNSMSSTKIRNEETYG